MPNRYDAGRHDAADIGETTSSQAQREANEMRRVVNRTHPRLLEWWTDDPADPDRMSLHDPHVPQLVAAISPEYHLSMWVNEPCAYVNGVECHLDVPPRLRWGKTYVPLRFVAEATGCAVNYYGSWVEINNGADTLVVHIID